MLLRRGALHLPPPRPRPHRLQALPTCRMQSVLTTPAATIPLSGTKSWSTSSSTTSLACCGLISSLLPLGKRAISNTPALSNSAVCLFACSQTPLDVFA